MTAPAELAPCGTPAAYRRHLRHRETPDPACRAAATAQRRQAPLTGECWCCGRSGATLGGRGLCTRCYNRWRCRDFAGAGPGPEFASQTEKAREYAHIITTLSTRRAAEKLGVSTRTVQRWRAALREAS